MAKFKLEWLNEAGELDQRFIIVTEGKADDGIPGRQLVAELEEMIESTPVHHGDHFKVTFASEDDE